MLLADQQQLFLNLGHQLLLSVNWGVVVLEVLPEMALCDREQGLSAVELARGCWQEEWAKVLQYEVTHSNDVAKVGRVLVEHQYYLLSWVAVLSQIQDCL